METKELVIYKVWKSEYKLLIGVFLGIFLSIFLSNEFPQTIINGEIFEIDGTKFFLSLPILWLIPSGFFILALIHIFNVKYCLTGKGIEMTIGILSIRQRSVKIRYEDIRSVETEQSILERMLNIGTVEIGTSATGAIEVVFIGVEAPQEIQQMIQREKDRRVVLQKNNTYLSSD